MSKLDGASRAAFGSGAAAAGVCGMAGRRGGPKAVTDEARQTSLFEQAAAIEPERDAPPVPRGKPKAALSAVEKSGRKAIVIDDKAGHRKRLRARFDDGGVEALADYELLEMVLARAIIRGDTKPLAKALLAEFKTFANVVNAETAQLLAVKGIGERIVIELRLIRAAALKMMQTDLAKRELLSSHELVLNYLRAAQAREAVESFRILFLDKRNQLIADEVQGRGTVDHTPVYIREVVKRALELGATAMILVHNHPSGDPTPSQPDISMTKLIVQAAKPLGVTIHDHIIVGRQGHCSMKALGLF